MMEELSNEETIGSIQLPKWLQDASPSETLEDVTEDYWWWSGPASDLGILKYKYCVSQKNISEYRDNPEDFLSSYWAVTTHPAFWWKNTSSKSFVWHTDGGRHFLEAYPFKDGEGVIWCLEIGGHVLPYCTGSYSDTRLMVQAPTIEEAYIKLAERVMYVFNDDGTDTGRGHNEY